MSVAATETRVVLNGVENLGKYAVTLEEKCEAQAGQLQQLTKAFGNACDEVAALKKRLSKVEKENSALQQQVLGLQKEREKNGGRAASGGKCRRGSSFSGAGAGNTAAELGKDPMNVFPEELWRMIFGYLKDPKDLKSCYETCTKFQPLLQHERKVFLYSDVLKVLTSRVRGYLPPSKQTTSTLLNTRLVCSGWKECVDNFLQQDNQAFFHEPAKLHARTPFQFTPSYNPWDDLALREMSPAMNPMVSRHLFYKEAARRNLRNHLTEFLQKFGRHVWFFEIEISVSRRDKMYSSWYPFLVRCLKLMPNLKALWMDLPRFNVDYYYDNLHLLIPDPEKMKTEHPEKRISLRDLTEMLAERFPTSDSDDSEDEPENDADAERFISVDSSMDSTDSRFFNNSNLYSEVNKRKVIYLLKEISENGFPTIPTLKTLAIHDSLPPIMNAVLTANPQIEKLTIERNDCTVMESYGVKLDNLKELSLGYHDHYWDLSDSGLETFAGWRFRKLSIDIPNTSWTELFKILEQSWGETLGELNLTLCGPFAEKFPRLFMVNLKILSLTVNNFGGSLDFLLPLVNLEYLTVDLRCAGQRDYNSEESIMEAALDPIINLNVYSLEDSNIWKLLPKLKKIMARLEDYYNDYVEEEEDDEAGHPAWQVCTRGTIRESIIVMDEM